MGADQKNRPSATEHRDSQQASASRHAMLNRGSGHASALTSHHRGRAKASASSPCRTPGVGHGASRLRRPMRNSSRLQHQGNDLRLAGPTNATTPDQWISAGHHKKGGHPRRGGGHRGRRRLQCIARHVPYQLLLLTLSCDRLRGQDVAWLQVSFALRKHPARLPTRSVVF